MLVVGLPEFEVNDKGVFKKQEIKTWEKTTVKAYVEEIMIPKEVFIECYNKWIKGESNSTAEDI